MLKRLLIIGGSGQLGGAFEDEFCANGWEVLAPPRDELDIEEYQETIFKKVEHFRPTVIINTAWLPAADCEKDVLRAFRVNSLGAYALSRAAQAVEAIMVHISTDYVFDGSREDGFTEFDLPRPLNIQGASKHSGEELVAIGNSQHYIVRTSALFGNHAKPLGNFVLKMKARADANEKASVVIDQTASPTYAEDLVPVVRKMIEQKVPFGIYHITNTGITTWYNFAKKIFNKLGKDNLLTPEENAQDMLGVLRPRYAILRGTKLQTLNFPKMPTWENALDRYFESSLQ